MSETLGWLFLSPQINIVKIMVAMKMSKEKGKETGKTFFSSIEKVLEKSNINT